ncbi:hypothetical protein LOZ58_004096 [Ophidiomyces ophidiicola]|nr:hypothetical protein LOZ58_004096 [Ophidiomyces ophidiicola]
MEAVQPATDPSLVLDDEIAKIRSEIHSLANRRRVVSASLLSSNAVQTLLRPQVLSSSNPLAPVVLSAEKHTLSNHHRAVFSATAFPFTDPSPHADAPKLLGIRIDVVQKGGQYCEPYYVLLKRTGSDKNALQVYKHTIPAFIPLEQLQAAYLPVPDVSLYQEDNPKVVPKKQSLTKFVRALRQELVAWHLRRDAVDWLQESLGGIRDTNHDQTLGQSLGAELGIVTLRSASLETRLIRLEWRDGRVGRVSLSNKGYVDRAVVFDGQMRDKSMENILTAGDRRVETMIQRLVDATIGQDDPTGAGCDE